MDRVQRLVRAITCRVMGHKYLWYGPTFRYDACLRCGHWDGAQR